MADQNSLLRLICWPHDYPMEVVFA